MNSLKGISSQPVNAVEWVEPTTLRANDYNPNKVFPPEFALLKLSMLLSGWTQPIVARRDGEIIDGFHRWTLGMKDREIREMTDGLVPVVWARTDLTAAEQRMATIRHNRARGEHSVLKMSDIIEQLVNEHSMSQEAIAEYLGMELEEVDRLFDRSGMVVRGDVAADFNTGWEPDSGKTVA